MRRSPYFTQWLILVLFWVIVLSTVSFVAIAQSKVMLDILGIDWEENHITYAMLSNQQYFESTMFGILFGSFFFLINRLTDRPSIYRRSLGQVVLLRSGLYLGGFVLVFGLIFGTVKVFNLYSPLDWETMQKFMSYWQFWAIMCVLFPLLIVSSTYLLALARKIGPGYFVPWLTGKYFHPVTENRVFLFVDMQNSTLLAEKLGHIRYSQLIQDCFQELDAVLFRYRAQIYQYVGDEAVLTWEARSGLRKNRCIHVYFAFSDRLKKKAPYFLRKYGVVPFFKAGLNIGEVTVAEFGNIKREIAYHGDVMNTASRLQSLCNQNQRWLLASGDFHDSMHPDSTLRVEHLGSTEIKGRKEPIPMYSVQRVADDLTISWPSPVGVSKERKKAASA